MVTNRRMPESTSPNRWIMVLCLAGMALGVSVVGIGVAWSKLVTPAMVWSPQQATELKQAGDAFHAAREESPPSDLPGQSSTPRQPSPRELAEQRYNRLKADLAAAQSVRTDWGRRVVAIGFGLTIACGMGYLAFRGN